MDKYEFRLGCLDDNEISLIDILENDEKSDIDYKVYLKENEL